MKTMKQLKRPSNYKPTFSRRERLALATIKIFFAILALGLIWLCATNVFGGNTVELPQSELDAAGIFEPARISYENSIFIDPHRPGWLGDPKQRRFRCGEVVCYVDDRSSVAIVMDYRWDDETKQWVYKLLPAKYEEAQ
jgi:hypothetical protein